MAMYILDYLLPIHMHQDGVNTHLQLHVFHIMTSECEINQKTSTYLKTSEQTSGSVTTGLEFGLV